MLSCLSTTAAPMESRLGAGKNHREEIILSSQPTRPPSPSYAGMLASCDKLRSGMDATHVTVARVTAILVVVRWFQGGIRTRSIEWVR